MILKNICIKKKYNNVFKKTGIWLNLLANLHDQLKIIIILNIYKCIAHLFWAPSRYVYQNQILI